MVRSFEVDLTGFEVPEEVIEIVPPSVAIENVLLPIGFHEGRLVFATPDPDSQNAGMIDKLEFIFVQQVELVAAPNEQLLTSIGRHYGSIEQFDSEAETDVTFARQLFEFVDVQKELP